MKKISLFTLSLIIVTSSFCQLNFEEMPFRAALQKAQQSGKLIFLQLESGKCIHCNEVASKAFEDKTLADKLEQVFICIKVGADSPDRNDINSKYNRKQDDFGSLFLNTDGTLLHLYPGTSSLASSYDEHINKALYKAGEGLKVNQLEKMYADGNKTPGTMELLMQTKRTLGLETDSLLEEYVGLLPADSINSTRTLQFIASMTPVLDSKADLKMRRSPSFNKSWFEMNLATRVSTNNRIGHKSLQKAIREKNLQYAFRVASFMRSTHTNSTSIAALQAFDSKILDYFREIHDTLNYMTRAINFYDNYYMSISVDSIKRKDSLNMRASFVKADTIARNGNRITTRQVIRYSPITQTYSRELNNAAYTFYEFTNEPLTLAKALQWSARAIEFYETPEVLDTHAHLLYKTGKKKEAIDWEKRAIALKKKQGYDTKDFEKRLAAMK